MHKDIFHQYFEEILKVDTKDKEEEALLQEALQVLKKLYGETENNPKDHEKLVEIISSFGDMPCRIMPVNAMKEYISI